MSLILSDFWPGVKVPNAQWFFGTVNRATVLFWECDPLLFLFEALDLFCVMII